MIRRALSTAAYCGFGLAVGIAAGALMLAAIHGALAVLRWTL